jgi:phospholipid-binding lipoprotein MlaA
MRALTVLLMGLGGCATNGDYSDPRDPLEGFNRGVYTVNKALDTTVIKPAAQLYDWALPDLASRAVSNFFGNLSDVVTVVNDLLQLKLAEALNDGARVAWNTTAGVGGLMDVASHMDLPKREEDFGQTLGYWGVESGPYLVLPLLGPSSFRDGVGRVGDYFVDPVTYVDDPAHRNTLTALRVVDRRAALLKVERVVEEAALDEYTFVRDAYLQRRRSLVYDGEPPLEDVDIFDDLEDEGLDP